MINFKLEDINNIAPAGTGSDLRMSWFWLTEAQLWLTFGETTIYEYTQEALDYFGKNTPPYSKYPLIRFIEDIAEKFHHIGENIPEKYYDLTSNIDSFLHEAKNWLAIYDRDENEISEFYFNEYNRLISWVYKRSFDSAHLIGGPLLSFYRYDDKLRVVWKTEYKLDNGVSLWTAKDGNFEISYSDFIKEIKDFGTRFFNAMDKQVELANLKDWKNIQIDKNRLIEEHKERKRDFDAYLELLKQGQDKKTDWAEIESLYQRMNVELKNGA